jgi:16S rRNA (adenine1518-N6/adenine1519-N6)-dimethyltransferase
MKNKHIFKKKYGQNFISDINFLKIILSKSELEKKNVVEIGTGKGIFTRLIAQKAKKVLTYEIDKSLEKFLDFKNFHNIDIIYDDILKRNLEQDIKHFFQQENVVLVGNLPYYITSPLLFKILFLDQIKTFLLLIQKEVGLRILSQETKKYNFLSVIIQSLTRVNKIKYVKNTIFFPKPKVDGIFIRFDRIFLEEKEKKFIKNQFYFFVKLSFRQKRKNLINNLSLGFNLPKEKIIIFFEKYKIPLNIRAEQINITQFKKISLLFFNFFNLYKKK